MAAIVAFAVSPTRTTRSWWHCWSVESVVGSAPGREVARPHLRCKAQMRANTDASEDAVAAVTRSASIVREDVPQKTFARGPLDRQLNAVRWAVSTARRADPFPRRRVRRKIPQRVSLRTICSTCAPLRPLVDSYEPEGAAVSTVDA
jgi:hypothetical protein